MQYILPSLIIFMLFGLAAGYYGFINVFDSRFNSKPKKRDPDFLDSDKDIGRPTSRRLREYRKEKIEAFSKLELEKLQITSFDGLKLYGYLLKGNPKEVVICVHGYKSNKEEDFADKTEIYLKRGSTVLYTADRAHGESEGRYIGFSELDRFDIASWVDKINEIYDEPRIYLHGVSMGGASVIHCADMKLKNVRGIIDDCGFDCIQNILDHVWKVSFGIPFIPFGYFTAIWAKILGHMNVFASIGERCVRKTDVPILFIHGLEDHFVPCRMSVWMYDLCSSKKELLLIEDCGHSAAYMCAEQRYTEAVNRMLDGTTGE